MAHAESTCEHPKADNASAPSFKCWPALNAKIKPSNTFWSGKNSWYAENRRFSKEDNRHYASW